jgi:hypothetical protein
MVLARQIALELGHADVPADSGAYLLGSTSPDIRVITKQDRLSTHFFDLNEHNHQDSVASFLETYGTLAAPENNTRGQKNAMSWDQGASQACRAAWDRAGSQSSDRDMQGGSRSGKQGGSQAGSSDTNRRNS